MPYVQEISFFHDCGHIENHIWSSKGDMPDGTRPGYPTFDFTKVITDSDEVGIEEEEELHYQERLCSSCSKAETDKTSLTALSEAFIAERCPKWKALVEAYPKRRQSLPSLEDEAREVELRAKLEEIDVQIKLKAKEAPPYSQRIIKSRGKYCRRRHINCFCHPEVIAYESYEHEITMLYRQKSPIERELEASEKLEDYGTRRYFFKSCISRDQQEEEDGTDPREREYLLEKGLDTKLLAFPELEKCAGEKNCSICREDLLPGRARSLPCGHVFHYGCISTWLQTNKTCPICRREYIIKRFKDYDRAERDFQRRIADEEYLDPDSWYNGGHDRHESDSDSEPVPTNENRT